MAQRASFVYSHTVEHNWKKMTLFHGFAVTFLVKLNQSQFAEIVFIFATFDKESAWLLDLKIPNT